MNINDFNWNIREGYCQDKRGRFYKGYFYDTLIDDQYVIVDFVSNNSTESKRIHWSISLTISDYKNEQYCEKLHKQKLITGHIGIKGLLFAKAAIEHFEVKLCKEYADHKNSLYCHWIDKRRRRTYAYALKKLGYRYGLRKFRPCLQKEII